MVETDDTTECLGEGGGSHIKVMGLRTVPTNTEVFCVVYDYAGKADASKDYWNPK